MPAAAGISTSPLSLTPAAISVLRGVKTPEAGGDTLFVNLEALYDGLAPALQTLLDGLRAVHSRDDAANGRPPAPRVGGRTPGPFASLHPLVRVHPETGRKVLFLSGFVQAIDGLRGSEGDALLTFLSQELTNRQDLQARYRWTKDLIAVWDNRAVAHVGPIDGAFIEGESIARRTTVGGELPVGPTGFVSRSLVGALFNTIG
jgi:taurine dioxygenase